MPITIICDKDAPGAVDITNDWKSPYPLFARTFAHGCVIRTWEQNGYEDSDFFATYWDVDAGCAKTIEYGTTRAWTYPCAASVDATPEILALYAAELVKASVSALVAEDAELAQTPAKGKICTVVKGRKIAKGTKVEVLSVRDPVKFSHYGPLVRNAFVLYFKANGDRVLEYTNIENLAVDNHAQYITPIATLEARAQQHVKTYGNVYLAPATRRALARLG